jgi:hypothetical protein
VPDDMIDRELRTFNRLIAESLAIEAEDAAGAGALGFVARAMVLATMPHRKVEGAVLVRTNRLELPGVIGHADLLAIGIPHPYRLCPTRGKCVAPLRLDVCHVPAAGAEAASLYPSLTYNQPRINYLSKAPNEQCF